MKIKSDFVTNSSSTSFILGVCGNFLKDDFFELMGIKNDSPLAPIYLRLYEVINNNMKLIGTKNTEYEIRSFDDFAKKQITELQKSGKTVYVGELSTEGGEAIEAFFCTESFEVENETIIFNCLECVW